MSSPSTFQNFFNGSGRNQFAAQVLAATTETEFKVNTDTSGSPAIAVLTVPSGTGIAGSAYPRDYSDNPALINRSGRTWGNPVAAGQPQHNSQSFDFGRPFLVRVAGQITTLGSNAGNTFTVTLYNGTSKSGTSLCTTGALTGTETSTQGGSFILEAQLQWNSGGGLLGGQFWYQVLAGATPSYNTWATTSVLTAVTLANLNFCASFKFGNAAGGTVVCSELSLSQL